MTSFVYIHARSAGCYTVGHYDPSNNGWEPESDHLTDGQAAARAHYLNGGNPAYDQLVAALHAAKSALEAHNPASQQVINLSAIKIINAALIAAGVTP